MDNSQRNKVLCVCGIVCAICGVVIIAISIFDEDPAPVKYLTLGGLNLINGCLFFFLSKNRKS